eukprot:6226753-Ditylum_brightwellii.AAC.2
MEAFILSQHFMEAEIIKLNFCRMFLRVVVMSDITISDRKIITPDCTQYPPKQQLTGVKWPQQKMSNITTWRLWQRALRKIVY